MSRHLTLATLFVSLAGSSAGCAPSTIGLGRDAGSRADGDVTTADAGMTPSGLDGGRPPGRDGGFMECAGDSVMAETGFAPVDIIWVIDTSGSMRGEADIVQTNINSFASAIEASGIDYRVVMVSDPGYVVVPAPLGSDATRFMYAPGAVDSNDALVDVIGRFDTYGSFLRPDAITHVVAVTDDESERLSGGNFRTMMEALLGHEFTFHAIVSPPGSTHTLPICFPPLPCDMDGCSGPNGDAAENGDEYWSLASATGGRQFSICTPDWSALFSDLIESIAVPTPLPCRYGLPEPPGEMTLDRGRVNVRFTPSSGAPRFVPFVESFSNCSGEGWYYEGDQIVVCPTTCSALEADAAGRVDIAFGCETLII